LSRPSTLTSGFLTGAGFGSCLGALLAAPRWKKLAMPPLLLVFLLFELFVCLVACVFIKINKELTVNLKN
jgi:hypothetical protein